MKTRAFKNGNSQALRVPAALAFDNMDVDFEVERVGDELRFRPVRQSLKDVLSLFAALQPDSDEFERTTQAQSERDFAAWR